MLILLKSLALGRTGTGIPCFNGRESYVARARSIGWSIFDTRSATSSIHLSTIPEEEAVWIRLCNVNAACIWI